MSSIQVYQPTNKAELQVFCDKIYKSGLLNFKNPEQVFVSYALAESKKMSIFQFKQKYDVVMGNPYPKTQELYSRFIREGGKVKWIKTDEKEAVAEMWFPLYCDGKESFKSSYSMEDAKRAKLADKDNYKLNPMEMLRAKVLGKGFKAIAPTIYEDDAFYSVEEAYDFNDESEIVADVEIEPTTEEQKTDYKEIKRKLFRKLQLQNMTEAIMVEFFKTFDLDNNLESLEKMADSEDYLLKCIEQFEKEGNK